MSVQKMIMLGVIVAILVFLVPYSVPILLAFLSAVLLEPIVLFLKRTLRLNNRLLAVILTFIGFLGVVSGSMYWVGTQLVIQSVELAQKLPEYSAYVFEFVEAEFIRFQTYYNSLPEETIHAIQQALNSLETSALNTASTLARAVLGGVAQLPAIMILTIIYLVCMFLISLDLPRIKVGFMRLFTRSAREKVALVIEQLSRATLGFLGAQILLSVLTYIVTLIGLLILDVKYAMLIAFLIIIVDILPILGTGSFIVPWAVYSFVIDNDPRLAIGLLILFTVITVFRRTIEPKILGQSLGISALAALVSLFLGFQIIGFFGLILGPALVIIYEALRKAGFLRIKIDF